MNGSVEKATKSAILLMCSNFLLFYSQFSRLLCWSIELRSIRLKIYHGCRSGYRQSSTVLFFSIYYSCQTVNSCHVLDSNTICKCTQIHSAKTDFIRSSWSQEKQQILKKSKNLRTQEEILGDDTYSHSEKAELPL